MANLSHITSSKHPGGNHRSTATPPLPASASPDAASTKSRNAFAQKLLDALIILIVTLMPFHAFMSVSLGTRFGYQAYIQSWKEVALLLMVALVLAACDKSKIVAVLRRPLNIAIVSFAVLAISISWLAGASNQPAFWFGVKTDLGFLLAFILAQFGSWQIKKPAIAAFLAASTVVVVFGTLQAAVLPADFLSQFGYGPETIEPYAIVDPAVWAYRILSTLGGPNQLGSFLILPICLIAYRIYRRRQWLWLLPLGLAVFTLWHTYSRSAIIGAAISLLVMLATILNKRWRLVLAGLVAIGIITAAFTWNSLLANNSTLQAYLLHGSIFEQQILGSDEGRIAGVRQGIDTIQKHPLGQGLGSAGPASYHGPGGVITENYYLQVAVEAGVAGILLFLTITAMAGRELWRAKALPFVAALAGLSANNLFLHTWADSTTALTFWTLAGLIMGETYDDFA